MQNTPCSIQGYPQNITVMIYNDIQRKSNTKIKAILHYKKQNPLHKEGAFFLHPNQSIQVPWQKGLIAVNVYTRWEQSQPTELAFWTRKYDAWWGRNIKMMGAAVHIQPLAPSRCAICATLETSVIQAVDSYPSSQTHTHYSHRMTLPPKTYSPSKFFTDKVTSTGGKRAVQIVIWYFIKIKYDLKNKTISVLQFSFITCNTTSYVFQNLESNPHEYCFFIQWPSVCPNSNRVVHKRRLQWYDEHNKK